MHCKSNDFYQHKITTKIQKERKTLSHCMVFNGKVSCLVFHMLNKDKYIFFKSHKPRKICFCFIKPGLDINIQSGFTTCTSFFQTYINDDENTFKMYP